MAFSFLQDKIKVFISSRCGKDEEKYEIVRRGLKYLLEETGFISAYVFEEGHHQVERFQMIILCI